MRFFDFYGNDGLKQRLSAALSGGGLSHCYILVGPEGSGKKTLARLIAAAMECTGQGEQPCGVCPNCHKIFGGGHPDVITIDSDKATVPISVIRDMQADAYIRPNEGRRKIYLIPRAQDMLAPAQNALLKLLEGPPGYCAFLLMTDNAEKLLPTVRSRAVELELFPLSDQALMNALKKLAPNADPEARSAAVEQSDGYVGSALARLNTPDPGTQEQVTAIAAAIATGDEVKMLETLVPLEKLKRPELLALMTQLQLVLIKALSRQSGSAAPASPTVRALALKSNSQTILAAQQAVSYAITLLQANGSPGHCIGYLLATLSP